MARLLRSQCCSWKASQAVLMHRKCQCSWLHHCEPIETPPYRLWPLSPSFLAIDETLCFFSFLLTQAISCQLCIVHMSCFINIAAKSSECIEIHLIQKIGIVIFVDGCFKERSMVSKVMKKKDKIIFCIKILMRLPNLISSELWLDSKHQGCVLSVTISAPSKAPGHWSLLFKPGRQPPTGHIYNSLTLGFLHFLQLPEPAWFTCMSGWQYHGVNDKYWQIPYLYQYSGCNSSKMWALLSPWAPSEIELWFPTMVSSSIVHALLDFSPSLVRPLLAP